MNRIPGSRGGAGVQRLGGEQQWSCLGGPGPGLGSSGSAEERVDIHQVKEKGPVAGRHVGQGSSRGRGPGAGAGGERGAHVHGDLAGGL